MIERIWFIFVFILVSLIVFPATGVAFDDEDWQYWGTVNGSHKISDKWKLGFEEELRWGDDMHNPYYNHTDLGITYSSLVDWFDLGFNYRYINEEKSSEWKKEHRPHINGTVKWKWQDFSLSNRSRLEYREREDSDEAWQYRNKLSVNLPISLTKHTIQPYLAGETFFDSDSKELNRNRLYSGISFKIFKNLKAEAYYLWQRSKSSSSGKWSDVNAVGTKIKVAY